MIYRIQDADGRGPWKPGFSHRWVEDRDDHDSLVPWCVEFPILFDAVQSRPWEYRNVGTGCRTVEQLQRWFTPTEYAKLLKLGYWAVMIKPTRILAESNIQCLFQCDEGLRYAGKPYALYASEAITTPTPQLMCDHEQGGTEK